MKKYIFFIFLFFVCCSSCSLVNRTKTTTLETKQTVIDTIIHITYDTNTIEKSATVYDTVTIENKVARAKSFVDVKTGKLVLSLQGKIFDVPVKASVIETKQQEIKNIEYRKTKWYLYFITGFVLGIILTILLFIKK